MPNSSPPSQQQLTKAHSLSQGPKLLGTKIKPIGKVHAFGKKDVNLLTSAKKKKVLCEASTPSSSAGASLVNQIPRKKIKVSSLNLKGESTSSAHTSAQTSDSQLTKYFLTSAKAKTLDDEMIPCCSKFLSKAPSSPSGSSSGSTNSANQVKITRFLPIKKITKNRKLKFGAIPRMGTKNLKKLRVEDVDEAQSNAPLRDSCASTSAPSSKLLKKKKRSLKSLKKPLLH